MNDYKRGYEFGRFALELAERSKDPSIICKVLVAFAWFIKPWRDPFEESFPIFDPDSALPGSQASADRLSGSSACGVLLPDGPQVQQCLQKCRLTLYAFANASMSAIGNWSQRRCFSLRIRPIPSWTCGWVSACASASTPRVASRIIFVLCKQQLGKANPRPPVAATARRQ